MTMKITESGMNISEAILAKQERAKVIVLT